MLSSDHCGGRLGMVLGNKYPSKERDGSGTGIGGSRNLYLLFSLLLLNRGPNKLVSFSFGGRNVS